MNFSLELKIFILSHSVTSKQPHKIVQIHMRHPVEQVTLFLSTLTVCFICLSGHLTTIKSQNSASHLHGKGEVISEGTFKSVQSRGVSGYQILGGQTVMQCNVACRRRPVAPSILPKTGWAIAHPAHPPVTPLFNLHLF